ncbi:MAG: metallophosphoesterase, partial [Myxococcales bacterium]
LGLVGGAHYYFVLRLVGDTALSSPFAELATAAIATLGALLIAHPVLERSFGLRFAALGWPSNLWMGASFYLLLGLGVTDAWLALAGDGGLAMARARAAGVVALTGGAVVLGMVSALGLPRVKRVRMEVPGWPRDLSGFRIVQISDIHVGSLIRRPFARRLVDRINALDADVVAITGDLVDGSVHHLGAQVVPFGELRARQGSFFVTGNHDHYSGASRWVQRITELGIEALRNRRVEIGEGEASFELAGVDDFSSRRLAPEGHGYDLERALQGWDGLRPLVLLAHDPRTFVDARRRGVQVQLSGHTHGGQIWPFSWLVRLQTPFVAGVYRRGRSQLYVSRGTGYWGPPMRLLAPAEITELSLYPADSPTA